MKTKVQILLKIALGCLLFTAFSLVASSSSAKVISTLGESASRRSKNRQKMGREQFAFSPIAITGSSSPSAWSPAFGQSDY